MFKLIRTYCIVLLIFVTWITTLPVSAKEPLVLNDPDITYPVDSNYLEKIELTRNSFSLPIKVVPNLKRYPHNADVTKEHWYRFTLRNENASIIDWFLVSYFYTIDEIDIFVQDSTGKIEKQYFRDTMTVYSRLVQHKQPTFQLSLQPNETKTVYIKVKNESTYEYSFGIFSHFHFFSIYFREYLLVGLFYGLMLFVFIYSSINFLFFKDKVILIYIVFIIAQVTHMLFRDGNGLYVLPYHPELADLIKNLSRAALSVSILLYTLSFLKIKSDELAFKLVMLFIVARITFALIMLNNTSVVTFTFEFSAILISTFLSIRSLLAKDNDAKYVVVGFSLLCFSYFIFYLSVVWFSFLGNIGFFIMYFGVAAESIFTTLALTERFKRIRIDNFKKDQMYKELENTVAQRTELITIQNKILKEQSTELNQFLYSASHDLKGPLKSIEGLVHLAEKDPEVNLKDIYRMIREKLATLDANISDLASVTTLKKTEDKSEIINFHKIHHDTLKKYHSEINPDQISISLHVNITSIFKSDPFTLKTIYENIVENALKFRDPKKKPSISISIVQVDKNVVLRFEDNGVGIEKNKLQDVFNMFYRGNELSRNDTGLGLYIVKIAVKKLNGEITVDSTLGKGSIFTISIPYQS